MRSSRVGDRVEMISSFEKALGIAQTLLSDRSNNGTKLTREVISEIVDQVMGLSPTYSKNVDKNQLIAELETRFSVWIGRATALTDEKDHQAWLDSERKTDWRYWNRYRNWMAAKLPQSGIDALDTVTDRVLGLLEDPSREGPWDRRGLVVGKVQSGKTANYTGLICKAADAGYTVIIVLAGLHNNLRSQTQMRLDEGFLGYESPAIVKPDTTGVTPLGVGLQDPSIRPNTITNRSEKGDFSRSVAKNFAINPGSNPLLFVIKKNVSVLKNLLNWIKWACNGKDAENDLPKMVNIPLLMIDDEADHASVDTNAQFFDENGKPDEEHDPTRTNGLIRKILHTFEKSAYVGYTATPFANIFIHDKGRTEDHGEDLFPRSFIINLPSPSNYIGPACIFGVGNENEADTDNGLPLVKEVSDHQVNERQGWMPARHRNGHRPMYNGEYRVPPSVSEAICAFLLACAARRARGQKKRHNSMLIHVTRFISVQHAVKEQVDSDLKRLKRRIRFEDSEDEVLMRLARLWREDFLPTSEKVTARIEDSSMKPVSWEEVQLYLPEVVEDIKVLELNGSAGDALEYENHSETGLNVIAVGGDKLSRGLTLEGLTISYFLRSSRMYDTLMQMGRWFGYKPGYLDLCRLYTTSDLHDWYTLITEASEELRREFDHMAAVGGTPKDYGLRVRSHPALMVTSKVKMQNGTELEIAYAGSISETTVFDADPEKRKNNLKVTAQLFERLGAPDFVNLRRERPGGRYSKWDGCRYWEGVSVDEILGFLDGFLTHPDAPRANASIIKDYILAQNAHNELDTWSVALMSGSGREVEIAGHRVKAIFRSPKNDHNPDYEPRYVIKRVLSPRDESMDLDADAYQRAMDITQREREEQEKNPDNVASPSGPALRSQRSPKNGLLLLYPIWHKENDAPDNPFVGFGFSFPKSSSAIRVTYKVNNIYWEQEFMAQ